MNFENMDCELEAFVSSLRAETQAELAAREGLSEDASNEMLASLAVVDPQLALFTQALGEETQHAISSPSKSSQVVVGLATRRRRVRMAPLVAVAAAAALAFSLTNLGEIADFGQGVREKVASMAPWNRGAERDKNRVQGTRAPKHEPHEGSSRASRFSETIAPADPKVNLETSSLVHPLPVIENSTSRTTVPEPEPRKPTTRKPVRRGLSEQALMHKAHRLWKGGDVKAAQRLLRRVAYRSSNPKIAQAAFADLFSIGRELGGRAILVKEWGRYLQRYPKGRFAQDAMAGQCLSSDAAEKTSHCWKRYLKQFPKGRYARKAKKTLQKAP